MVICHYYFVTTCIIINNIFINLNMLEIDVFSPAGNQHQVNIYYYYHYHYYYYWPQNQKQKKVFLCYADSLYQWIRSGAEFEQHCTGISVSAVLGFNRCGAVRYKVLVMAALYNTTKWQPKRKYDWNFWMYLTILITLWMWMVQYINKLITIKISYICVAAVSITFWLL